MKQDVSSNHYGPCPKLSAERGQPCLRVPRPISAFLTIQQLVACVVACIALTGCRTTFSRPAALTAGEQPENVFKFSNLLSASIRRVAVLPLASLDSRVGLVEGREALQPVLLAELIKTKRFEIVPVSARVMRAKTGRDAWSAADRLTPDFFEVLREEFGCDAVLFAELTEYRAYAPVAVGWRFKLIDARTKAPIWAGDELFDSRRAEVVSVVQKLRAPGSWFAAETGADWAVSHSPRRFAQLTVAQMFDTLPVR